jgi:hypothetical protein
MQKAARVKVAWGGARSVHGGVGMHATSADFHVGVVSVGMVIRIRVPDTRRVRVRGRFFIRG